MNLYKSLITCNKCGKNFKYSKESNGIYVCSGYSNYGSTFCKRNKISHEDLTFIVKTGFAHHEIEWERDTEYLSRHIKSIIVYENGDIEVQYYKFESTFWTSDKIGV